MTTFKSLLYLTLLFDFYALNASARESIIPGSRYTSGRSAAVGDAFLPLGEDVGSGLFSNPANLAKIRKSELEPINLSLYGNTGYVAATGINYINPFTLSSFAPALAKNPGTAAGAGASAMMTFGMPYFDIGILYQSQVSAVQNSSGTITYRSLYQFIPSLGTGFRLFDGFLRIGYSAQWLNSATGTATVANTSSIGYDQNLNQGSALSNTLGIALTAPVVFLPTVNCVVRNLFTATYYPVHFIPLVSSPSAGLPFVEPMSIDVSFSIQPRLGRGTYLNLVVEDRDATNASNVAPLGHLALGGELSFGDKFVLRGGWSGGYPSAGIALRKRGSEFSLTYYSEEIGTGYLSQADTRFMMQYQIRAF
jgi:hypothetical protein